MNTFIFSGNLTKDAEPVQTKTGTAMLRFTVAVNSGWGDKEHCDFVNCVIFGKRAEGKLVSFLTKGKSVSGQGDLTLSKREYEGKTYQNLEVTVDKIELHGGKDSAPVAAPVAAPTATTTSDPSALEDDIPF